MRRDANTTEVKSLTNVYLDACKLYQVHPSPDVLSFLRTESTTFSVEKYSGNDFGALDMLPFVELLDFDLSLLRRLERLDFSKARWLGPSGTVEVAWFVAHPESRVKELVLNGQRPGARGVAALAVSVRENKNFCTLRMACCACGDEGGLIFASLLRAGDDIHRLAYLDLQNNRISFEVCQSIRDALKGQKVLVDLSGNQILDEVMNTISHGVGCVFAIAGTVILAIASHHKPSSFKFACWLYCLCLNFVYMASTLFHAFQGLGAVVRRIFEILDHCAIYLLIAGSYGPFLVAYFPRDNVAMNCFIFVWVAAITGILVTAFYFGERKQMIHTSLCLLMGWSCLCRAGEMIHRLSSKALLTIFLGGVLYSAGVPFFIKDRRTCGIPDHTIWHLFVLAGSISHYLCILWYALPLAGASNGFRH